MKLSNMSVLFIIIVLPIILLASYYISLQADTIDMQNSYTSKHLRATKEAIDAFEINTVEWNDAYSANSDSKRRDVMASINTFTTSFANGIGIGGSNKELIETYIPAIACTLYDGYYIYTPSETKEVVKDEKGVAVFVTERLSVSKYGEPIIDFDGNYNKEEHEGKLLYVYDSKKGASAGKSADGIYNNEVEFTLDSNYAKSTYEHILKPFTTYSARYQKGDIDITINYTLDNYITIYGNVKNEETDEIEYIVKSGYLIKTRNDLELVSEQLTEKIWYEGIEGDEAQEFNYVYADDNTKVYFAEDATTPEEGDYITFQVSSTGVKTNLNDTTSIKYKKIRQHSRGVVYQALNSGTINVKKAGVDEEVQINQGALYSNKRGKPAGPVQDGIEAEEILNDHSSRNYYIESTEFTEWVQDNLSEIKIEDMQGVEDKSLYGNSDDKLFDFDDPEDEDSIIVKHKRQIIKQSLISNLNQSITTYSSRAKNEDYSLPILTEEDWDHVFRNISIITFVQNIPIGLKHYNNYSLATSTENREYTNPYEIYLMREGDQYYHLPNCSQLNNDKPLIGYKNVDYVVESYNVKDADGNSDTKYYYKHSNIETNTASEACYYCLVQKDLYTSEGLSDELKLEHDNAYKIALARERYRNISEINLKDDLEYDIEVTFIANGGEISFNGNTDPTQAYKLVAYQGKYGER